MPGVNALGSVSGRDPEAKLTQDVRLGPAATEPHANQPAELGEPADSSGSSGPAPARSLRRATARRASNRRATARSRQGDTDATIIAFLAHHPGSTAGDLAKGLNLNPGSVSLRLTQLANAGEIKKAPHGYSTN